MSRQWGGRGNYLAVLAALAASFGGRFSDAAPRIGPREPRVVDETARARARAKRAERQLRRLATAACNPEATNTHRAPCESCWYCAGAASLRP